MIVAVCTCIIEIFEENAFAVKKAVNWFLKAIWEDIVDSFLSDGFPLSHSLLLLCLASGLLQTNKMRLSESCCEEGVEILSRILYFDLLPSHQLQHTDDRFNFNLKQIKLKFNSKSI